MRPSALQVAVLFPELLGTYGDGGNVVVLEQRLAWRGLAGDIVNVGLGDPVPSGADLYVLGGGEDRAQVHALAALRRGTGLQQAVARGATVLAVCAGLQLLGSSITDRSGQVSAGLGLLDADTRLGPDRLVGEVVAVFDPALGLPPLTGFANHAGRTRLGPAARPLARATSGPGNDGPGNNNGRRRGRRGERPPEGALQGSLVATYLHGPVLARNPALADLVLARALGHALAPLPLPEVDAVRRERLGGRPDQVR